VHDEPPKSSTVTPRGTSRRCGPIVTTSEGHRSSRTGLEKVRFAASVCAPPRLNASMIPPPKVSQPPPPPVFGRGSLCSGLRTRCRGVPGVAGRCRLPRWGAPGLRVRRSLPYGQAWVRRAEGNICFESYPCSTAYKWKARSVSSEADSEYSLSPSRRSL
jgi:hypothetical protein